MDTVHHHTGVPHRAIPIYSDKASNVGDGVNGSDAVGEETVSAVVACSGETTE